MVRVTRKIRQILLMPAVGVLVLASAARAQEIPVASYALEDAIAIALEHNRDLGQARLGLESAEGQVREAWSSVLPDIDGSVRYMRNLVVPEAFLPAFIFDPTAPPDALIPVRFGADNTWNADLMIRQPIFDAGAFIGVGTAGRFRELQEEVVRGAAQQTVTRVRHAYYLALVAREAERVIEESVRRTETTLKETEGLNRVGLASNYDVLRLQVRLNNLRPDVRRAGNAAAAAERTLSVEMGLNELVQVDVRGELHTLHLASAQANEGANRDLIQLVGYPNALDRSYEELMQTAGEMRSELRQARLARDLEDARRRYERTSYFPRLNAFFNYGIIAQENGALNPFGEDPNQRSTFSQVGLELEIPVFKGFGRSARMQQRSAALRQAELQVALIEQRIGNEVRTAYEALQEAKLRADAQFEAVSEAERGFEIVSAQYLAGTSSQLEQTEGEVLWRESELSYAEAVFDYLVAQAELDRALGVVPLVDVRLPGQPEINISQLSEND